jgi:hypothetical protein
MQDLGTSHYADLNPLQVPVRQQIRDGSDLGPGLQQHADAGQIGGDLVTSLTHLSLSLIKFDSQNR